MSKEKNLKYGRGGEVIVEDNLLTTIDGEFLFDPAFLGETFPDIDFYVKLSPDSKDSLYFLLQVKTTTQGYDRQENLKIACPADKLKALAKIPAPTYLLGVDYINKKVYARFIKSPVKKGLTRLPTNFELTPKNLKLLYKEVVNYWKMSKTSNHKKKFKSVTHD